MQTIQVTDKKTIEEFHQVPRVVYKNDKKWIPHLKQDIEKVFDPEKNKAFQHGEIERWIFKDDAGNLIGRVAAFVDKKLSATFDQPTGGLGFFEVIEDKEIAFKIFDHCRDWLKERGVEAMDGPINFGEKNQFWGLLIENFDDPGLYAMNYNPPYYKDFFEEYGFQIYYNQLVYWRDMQEPQPIFYRKYNQMKRDPDYLTTDIRGMSWEKVAEDFRTVYNDAWGGHEDFKPMEQKTAMKLMKAMKPVVDKRIICFVYYKKKPIAFYINLPELNQIFRYVNGNLNWLGKLKFLYHKWVGTPTTMNGIVFGVAKEFQGKGMEAAMIVWAYEHIAKKKLYTDTVLTWIGDFNPKMIKVCENLGASNYRTLATYRYLFDREKPFERAPIID